MNEFGLFLVAGTATTVLDLLVFNGLAGRLGWRRVPANCVSTSVAMTFSFSVNRLWVFGAGAGSLGPQLGLFLLVTGSSSYLLQNGIIHWLSHRWLWPGRVMCQLAGKTERLRGLGRDFVERNTAKAIAIAQPMDDPVLQQIRRTASDQQKKPKLRSQRAGPGPKHP
jgi:putative flippase GtrA